MKIRSAYYIPALLLVCFFIFFTNLDVIYVNIMEARNFITAREMLQYGNWFKTTMNLEPRYEKPPLPTWLTAFSASIFGLKNLVGLRLPAALSATFLIISSYFFGIRIFNNKKQSFIASLILATSFYIIFSGRNGQWDIFAHSFMLFAIYKLFIAFEDVSPNWKNFIGAGIFLGLSFMSKGPVSLFALLLPFLIAYGIIYKFSNYRQKITPIFVMILFFVIVGLSWGIYIYLTDSSSANAIAEKETVAWANRNIRSWYYYWSFFTQSGLWTFFSFIALLYPFMIKRVADKKAYKFTFVWTITTVILLSLIPEKKARYLLPVLIPMALNTSFYIHYLIIKGKQLLKTDRYITNIGFGLVGLICITFPLGAYFYFKDKLDGFWVYYTITSIILPITGIFIFYSLTKKKYENAFYSSIFMMCVIMTIGFPMAKIFYDNPNFNNISELRKNESLKSVELYRYDEITPELIWELGEPIKIIDETTILPTNSNVGFLATYDIPDFISQKYILQPVDTFDINYVNPSKKGYKNRLTAKLYLIQPK